jgi:ABC-2 type transport system ATP-binding protein
MRWDDVLALWTRGECISIRGQPEVAGLGRVWQAESDEHPIRRHSPNAGNTVPLMIAAVEATKVFGSTVAVDSLTLNIPTGATALLGRNGAGKTTFINMVSNVVLPTAGSVSVDGHPAGSAEATEAIARQLDFATSAGHMTPPRLVRMLHMSDTEAVSMRHNLDRFDVPDRPLGKLSKGNQLKLALALVFAMERPVLLLDEPTAGLDFFGVEILSNLIADRTARGMTTLIATHQPTFTPDLFNRALVIDAGPPPLRRRPRRAPRPLP